VSDDNHRMVSGYFINGLLDGRLGDTVQGISRFIEYQYLGFPYHSPGYGKALLLALVREAVDHDCGRMDWQVLDWNQPAIEFYRRLGAAVLPEWELCRLQGDTLKRLAAGAPSTG